MEIKGNLHKMEQKDLIKRLSDYIEYDALTKPTTFAKGPVWAHQGLARC